MGKVVLIPKADKPRYDVVRAWRMIHLLPCLAKMTERILYRMAKEVELEPSQFGSWKKRGVHNGMVVVYEFLRHNKHMKCAILSMDIEGGFDNIDMDMLTDILVARACPEYLVCWVSRWAGDCSVRFKFNGRISKVYHVTKGIPQSSLLSPFIFGVYVADLFPLRLWYTLSL